MNVVGLRKASREEFFDASEPVTGNENETGSILWDLPVHTDKEIKSNRPDLIIKDQELRKCLLIDMAIPAE